MSESLPTVIAAEKRVLDPLIAAQKLLQLIEGADHSGVLALLTDGSTVDAIANHTSMDSQLVTAIIEALIAGGVVHQTESTLRLTDDWRAVSSTAGIRPLRTTLAGERAGADMLRKVGSGDDYWTVSPTDQVALAASFSPDPVQGSLVATFPAQAANDAPLPAAASKATRYLELGCGVAGNTLSMLQAFPQLNVVGVELSDDLADEAERRAASLGLQDRFSVVRCDAADFHHAESFDMGFWSQFFFADEARAGALHALFTHVRSGGLVAAPIVHHTGDEPDAVRQRATLLRVLTQSWGVPARTPDALIEEFVAAGFVDAQLTGRGGRSMLVVATRP